MKNFLRNFQLNRMEFKLFTLLMNSETKRINKKKYMNHEKAIKIGLQSKVNYCHCVHIFNESKFNRKFDELFITIWLANHCQNAKKSDFMALC